MPSMSSSSHSHKPAKSRAAEASPLRQMANKPAQEARANPGPGNCLIHLETERLLGINTQAASYLGIDQANSEEFGVRTLIPELTEEQWSLVFDQNDQQDRSFFVPNVGQTMPKLAVKLTFMRLHSPQQTWLLLTICPQSSAQATVLQSDALTGLPDRRQLVIHHENLRQTTGKNPTLFALLFMDLDDFKKVNDQHGHAAGDQILVALASRWQNCIRDKDLVARYGGDEFIVLLAGITCRQDAQPVIARLTAATSQPIPVNNRQLTVHVTIGMALSEGAAENIDELIASADRDMYAVKATRKAGNAKQK